jgi:hypothetical protein
MVLESYFDDSSDPKRAKFWAVGGLIGGSNQWDAFEHLWRQETAALKEPFRSTDCETHHGQFENWSKSESNDLMARLVAVIRITKLRGFASLIPSEDFKRAFPAAELSAPFVLAARQAIMNMAFIANELGHDARICFEKGSFDAKMAAREAA